MQSAALAAGLGLDGQARIFSRRRGYTPLSTADANKCGQDTLGNRIEVRSATRHLTSHEHAC